MLFLVADQQGLKGDLLSEIVSSCLSTSYNRQLRTQVFMTNIRAVLDKAVAHVLNIDVHTSNRSRSHNEFDHDQVWSSLRTE